MDEIRGELNRSSVRAMIEGWRQSTTSWAGNKDEGVNECQVDSCRYF